MWAMGLWQWYLWHHGPMPCCPMVSRAIFICISLSPSVDFSRPAKAAQKQKLIKRNGRNILLQCPCFLSFFLALLRRTSPVALSLSLPNSPFLMTLLSFSPLFFEVRIHAHIWTIAWKTKSKQKKNPQAQHRIDNGQFPNPNQTNLGRKHWKPAALQRKKKTKEKDPDTMTSTWCE
ncbi:hypothetical protein K457DRAFT_570766 [Linnemannia elongata AG-77]|uniref:Secreted protein n=1 Tax=Linnemannia elongata AG-77 TaxID=1314771 RepID=A0A197KCA0_9FUNG|nr:hypothetical protein K457DRAFT_570766 [Linnemannia elongata AG-77]